MNMLEYKGYIGSVEISEEDNCLFGKVLHLPQGTLISYEGETVEELRNDFHESVDAYIELCEQQGIEPLKSFSGQLNIRLTPEIHAKVATVAKRAGITINAFIRKAVERGLAAML